jgi:hypothetical protein
LKQHVVCWGRNVCKKGNFRAYGESVPICWGIAGWSIRQCTSFSTVPSETYAARFYAFMEAIFPPEERHEDPSLAVGRPGMLAADRKLPFIIFVACGVAVVVWVVIITPKKG